MGNVNQKEVKSILTNDQGKGEIQKHQSINSDCIYLKILDIRKNEHFGALLMFLNKRSPLSLRVKSKKAELFFLKKLDAIEISSSYPNIWKRVNKASFHNLKQIKKIIRKIILHYCETYGINLMKTTNEESENGLERKNTAQNKINKEYYNNYISILSNKEKNRKRFTALPDKTQLKMLKEMMNSNNTYTTSKTYEEKRITQPIIKDFGMESNNDMQKKITSSASNEDQLNCTLNVIKIKNKNTSSKKEAAFLLVDSNKNNSKNKSENNNYSEGSKETKTKEGIKSNKINYGKDETNKLIQNYGTPFYPEDINDEIYPQEMQPMNYINNNAQEDNNSKEEEFEQIPFNYLLSSQNSIKNNYIKTIQEFNEKEINKGKSNNITINNNFIANKVINNNAFFIKNELKTFHFGFNFKSKADNTCPHCKQKKDSNQILNLAVFQNSFELSANKNQENVNFDLNKAMKENESNKDKERDNDDNLKQGNKSSFSESSDNDSFSSSESNGKENKKLEKSFTDELPQKKRIRFPSTVFSNVKRKIRMNNKFQVFKNNQFKLRSEYFNINQLAEGKFSKSKIFQDYIKNAIIKKLPQITLSKTDLSEVKDFAFTNKVKHASNIKITKKSSVDNFQSSEKIKNAFPKHQRSTLLKSEVEKGRDTNIGKRKVNKRNNNTILNYINRNIRDDSAVLYNPGKFYNGLFNDMMKKCSKVNPKQFQK